MIDLSARVHRKWANENRRTHATSFHFDRAISVFTVLAIQKYIETTTTKRNEAFGLTFCKVRLSCGRDYFIEISVIVVVFLPL